ncbi:hypothetical protein MPER_12963 [Moniliophthora perniciosa FA553]|nr:hypothetical protein MPER_12963 [Moniliophthora perniciosa FA553]
MSTLPIESDTNKPHSDSQRRVFDVFQDLQGILSNRSRQTRQETGGLDNFDAEVDLDEGIGHLRMDANYCDNDDDIPELQVVTREESDWEDDEEDDEDDEDEYNDQIIHQRPRKVQKIELQHSILTDAEDHDAPALLATAVDNTVDVVNPVISPFNSMSTPALTTNTRAASAPTINADPTPASTSDTNLNVSALPDNFHNANLSRPMLNDMVFVKHGNKFICKTPHPDSAEIINAWIMDACDAQNPDGTMKPDDQLRSSYSHAEKKRAGALWGYQQVGLTDRWHANETTGQMTGNPVASFNVSKYMNNLKRQKVREGETPTSSRAITPKMLMELFNLAREEGNYDIKPVAPSARKHDEHGKTRRYGGHETLNIEAHNIKLTKNFDKHGQLMELRLPFRKTHQYGDIKPFYLRKFPEELAYLCPIRAWSAWYDETDGTGFLFRKIGTDDRIDLQDPSPMCSVSAFMTSMLMETHMVATPSVEVVFNGSQSTVDGR